MTPAQEFTPTCPPDDPTVTGLLLHHLGECIDRCDGAAVVETLEHMKTAAGDQFTRELVQWLIACGLSNLVSSQ